MKFSPSILPPKCRILVIRLRSLGDVVLNTPVLENLKLNFPDSHISVLVESPFGDALHGNPVIDEIIVRERKRVSCGNGLSVFWEEVKFFLDLRRRKFHLALDFHGGPRAANIAFLCGARWRMGHQNSPRRWAYNVHVSTLFSGTRVHTVKEQLSKLESLGLKTTESDPKIWVSEEEKEASLLVLDKVGVRRGEPYAVIHPGVVKPHQRWQPEKMAQIADHIQKKLNLKTVFSSTKEQISQVEEILSLMKSQALSLAGKTNIRELIALLSGARFLVCHNGGQMHLSAAVGTPVFVLFGPSTPEIFGPVGKDHRVFYKRLSCSPCAPHPLYESCLKGKPKCMEEIQAEEIIRAINEFMKKKDSNKC